MGITGLLPLLASVTRPTHLAQFAGLRVAIDAYVWLHRGSYGCSFELCQGIGTHKYLAYCMKMVNLLRHYKVIPVLVFDGGNLPSKKGTEISRRDKRKEAREKGMELLQAGDRKAAAECFQRAVDVTPRMAFNLIELLRKEGVEFVVAPYEADAQLTFLCLNGLVDAVISEDSDLIPYGCPRMIYKLDKDGNGKEVLFADLGAVTEVDLSRFSAEMLRHMCILSGCDYLESLPGMGLKKAHALLLRHGSMGEVFRALENSKMSVPEDYALNFGRADLTFQHQIVYDPTTRKTVHLHPLPDDVDPSTLPFAGEHIADHIAQLVADGRVDPHTYEPFILSIPQPISAPHSQGHHLLSSSAAFSQGATQPLSQASTSTSTPQRLSTQWNTKAMTPLSAAMQQTSGMSNAFNASRSGLSTPSLSQDEMAKHDNDMTRDVRRYTMQRGSSRGVGSAASTASSIIAASSTKQSNNIHSYFLSAPKTPTTPSTPTPTGLFRQRSSGLTASSSSPTKLTSTTNSLSPSFTSTPVGTSTLQTSEENSVLRSRFFSPSATPPPKSISPPVEKISEYTAISWNEEDDDCMALDPELEALIQHGRQAPPSPAMASTPSKLPTTTQSSPKPAVVTPTPTSTATLKVTSISLLEDSPPVSQTVPVPAPAPVAKVQPMRLSIPMRAYSSAFNDDSDEEFELVRLDSTTAPVPVETKPAAPKTFIQSNIKPSPRESAQVAAQTMEKQETRDFELGSDSVVIPIPAPELVAASSSSLLLTVSKTTTVSQLSQTSFTAPTSQMSLFDDIAESEQFSLHTPSTASISSYNSPAAQPPSSSSASNRMQVSMTSANSSETTRPYSPTLTESTSQFGASTSQSLSSRLDLSKFIIPAPGSPSGDSAGKLGSSSSTPAKTARSPVPRISATTSTHSPSRSNTKDLSAMIAKSPTKLTKKRKELSRDGTIELETSPPLKVTKSPLAQLPTYQGEAVDLIDLGD